MVQDQIISKTPKTETKTQAVMTEPSSPDLFDDYDIPGLPLRLPPLSSGHTDTPRFVFANTQTTPSTPTNILIIYSHN